MIPAIDQLNFFHGSVVTRKQIQEIIASAKKQNETDVIFRLSKVLNDNPKEKEFKLKVKQYKPGGLNGARHKGAYKEALDNCGRLLPGYKFENGSVVKVKPKVKEAAAKPVTKKVAPTKKVDAKPKAASKAPTKQNQVVKPAKREKKLTKEQFLKLLKATSKKDYDTKIDYIKGYLDIEKKIGGLQERYWLAINTEKHEDAKIIEKANKKEDAALYLQVEQGAKYFKIVEVDFISAINLYTEDSTAFKKAIWPEDVKPTAPTAAAKVKRPEPKKVVDKNHLDKVNPKAYAVKPKSVSVATAIADVLSTGNYPGISPMQANVLYSVLKGVDDIAAEEIQIKAKEFQQAILLKIPETYIYYFDWDNTMELKSQGIKLINAINGRINSLKNQKSSYAMFDGLKGLGEGVNCLEPEPIKAMPIPVKKTSGAVSSQELMSMHFESLKFDGEWADFMQEPAKNMKIAIWGKPKNGKTSGAAKFANYLTRFGNVLYNFVDQGFNKSTQDIWKNSGLAANDKAYAANARTLEELDKLVASGEYQFVFIDMINNYIDLTKIKPFEFKERYINKYPDVSFILVFEVTKGGDFKGDQGWTHVVDALVTVEDFLMENRGRYGVGHHIIWEDGFKKFNPKKYEEITAEATPEPVATPTETPGAGLKFRTI